jgi:hypothetical protein
LQLYDNMTGKRSHAVYENWLQYARENYMSVTSDGKIKSFTLYYDRQLKYNHALSEPTVGSAFYRSIDLPLQRLMRHQFGRRSERPTPEAFAIST